jgi:hypothetical protein
MLNMMLIKLSRWLLLSALLLGPASLRADLAAGAPPSQQILVITGTSIITDFTKFMAQNGNMWGWCAGTDPDSNGWINEMQLHGVTVQTTVPALATLQTYDQVYDMRFDQTNCTTFAGCGTNAISAGQMANYLSYIAAGGSLFLMGDNGGYPGRNDNIVAIARSVDSAATFGTGGVLTNNDAANQGALYSPAAGTAAENYGTDYRNLAGSPWIAAQYNGVVHDFGAGFPVLRDILTNDAVAVAFDCHNMAPATATPPRTRAPPAAPTSSFGRTRSIFWCRVTCAW